MKLSSDEVRVHVVPLNVADERLARYRAHLSPDELARAERFRFETDRCHFIAARGALREILAHHLDASPDEISFTYGRKGKPALDMSSNGSDLQFNLSHAGGLALIAVTSGREVGVDVERIDRDISDADAIARRFFTAEEVAALDALPASERRRGFFRCWTRKEAFIKAVGDGLSMRLSSFTVSVEAGGSRSMAASAENGVSGAKLIRLNDTPDAADRRLAEQASLCSWSIIDVKPDENHEAAVAVGRGAGTALPVQEVRSSLYFSGESA